jgi:hypothetical protein
MTRVAGAAQHGAALRRRLGLADPLGKHLHRSETRRIWIVPRCDDKAAVRKQCAPKGCPRIDPRRFRPWEPFPSRGRLGHRDRRDTRRFRVWGLK